MKLIVNGQEVEVKVSKIECLFTKKEAETLALELKRMLETYPDIQTYRIRVS